ncbi:hypothetical protein EYF80_022812 [Liparis tanakae]|uniref:Uncharacterized protein n=1 Tax=Liparis tanakae TaxID=230148 RepID=A0A4Z2HMD3_9TELE|nr:hypothetical protein EYF80_022812 [Liparis tanakae]
MAPFASRMRRSAAALSLSVSNTHTHTLLTQQEDWEDWEPHLNDVRSERGGHEGRLKREEEEKKRGSEVEGEEKRDWE